MTLTGEQVLELTRRVNGRIDEFGCALLDPVSAGIVRLAYDEFEVWQREQVAAGCHNGHHAPALDFGDVEVGGELPPSSNGATMDSGSPQRALALPTTLGEVGEGELTALRQGSEERAASLRAIIGELQMMSEHGEMPSMRQWDEGKPSSLAKSSAICQRFNLSWSELARYAKLDFQASRRKAWKANGDAAQR